MKKLNVWTLIETSSKNNEILAKINCNFVIKIDNYKHRAHLFEYSFPEKMKQVWETSPVLKRTIIKTYGEPSEEIMIIETTNNTYKFHLNCKFYTAPILDSFKESLGGKLSTPERLEDKTDIYSIGDYELAVKYFSHTAADGKDYYLDDPECVSILKNGTAIYAIDNPNLKDLVNVFKFAKEKTLEWRIKEFSCVYVYGTDSYIE